MIFFLPTYSKIFDSSQQNVQGKQDQNVCLERVPSVKLEKIPKMYQKPPTLKENLIKKMRLLLVWKHLWLSQLAHYFKKTSLYQIVLVCINARETTKVRVKQSKTFH